MFCVIIDIIAFDHIGGIPLQLQHSQGANLGQDKISRLLFQLALPAILAQLINLLYNMVDRMYIGHIPDVGPNALTGVGVTLPLIMCISAFAALVSMGGAPRASIMMGKGEPQQAERILGNCASMLVITALVLPVDFLRLDSPLPHRENNHTAAAAPVRPSAGLGHPSLHRLGHRSLYHAVYREHPEHLL